MPYYHLSPPSPELLVNFQLASPSGQPPEQELSFASCLSDDSCVEEPFDPTSSSPSGSEGSEATAPELRGCKAPHLGHSASLESSDTEDEESSVGFEDDEPAPDSPLGSAVDCVSQFFDNLFQTLMLEYQSEWRLFFSFSLIPFSPPR